MKVLQTLGRSNMTKAKGIFRYRRLPAGIEITTIPVPYRNSETPDSTSTARDSVTIQILNQRWVDLLGRIASLGGEQLWLTPNTEAKPGHVLYTMITDATGIPDRFRPYVCAILEHEGSIDLYHQSATPVVCIPLVGDVIA